jgi:hypothetical protein
MDKIIDRLQQFMDKKGLNDNQVTVTAGLSIGLIGKARKANKGINSESIEKILHAYAELSPDWLLTGRGDMLKVGEKSDRKKIPLYDVTTIGGINELSANMEGAIKPSEWIDAGDWFGEATSAIHHYGDSMVEYPSGCILALREISDMQLIVWGKNYVIETDEYRITKRLQRGNIPDFVIAYSSNEESYRDGTLIHQPIEIPKQSIRRLALVLGYVVKEQSSGKVYNIRNRR